MSVILATTLGIYTVALANDVQDEITLRPEVLLVVQDRQLFLFSDAADGAKATLGERGHFVLHVADVGQWGGL